MGDVWSASLRPCVCKYINLHYTRRGSKQAYQPGVLSTANTSFMFFYLDLVIAAEDDRCEATAKLYMLNSFELARVMAFTWPSSDLFSIETLWWNKHDRIWIKSQGIISFHEISFGVYYSL